MDSHDLSKLMQPVCEAIQEQIPDKIPFLVLLIEPDTSRVWMASNLDRPSPADYARILRAKAADIDREMAGRN